MISRLGWCFHPMKLGAMLPLTMWGTVTMPFTEGQDLKVFSCSGVSNCHSQFLDKGNFLKIAQQKPIQVWLCKDLTMWQNQLFEDLTMQQQQKFHDNSINSLIAYSTASNWVWWNRSFGHLILCKNVCFNSKLGTPQVTQTLLNGLTF